MSLPSIFDYCPQAALSLWKTAEAVPRTPVWNGIPKRMPVWGGKSKQEHESEDKESPGKRFLRRAAPVFAGTALGAAAGWGAGRITGKVLDAISETATGYKVPAEYLLTVGGIAGALGAKFYDEHTQREVKELGDAYEDYRNRR